MSRSSRSTWLDNGEVGAQIEQIVLDAPQHRIQFGRIGQMHPHNADRGVGLVYGAIGGNAQIIFRTAFAAAERGGAVIAGSCVDSIKHDHCVDGGGKVGHGAPA